MRRSGSSKREPLSCLVQDVTALRDSRLIGRAYVSAAILITLQGGVHAMLVSPDLACVIGEFNAGFLVVTSLEHPYNNLGDLQRAKWSPAAASLLGTLDIGYVWGVSEHTCSSSPVCAQWDLLCMQALCLKPPAACWSCECMAVIMCTSMAS